MEMRWIPIEEREPEVNEDGVSEYLLVSCSNFPVPCIGRYEADEDGGGIFYEGDGDRSLLSYGLFVNAWMPLPKAYKEDEDEKRRDACQGAPE